MIMSDPLVRIQSSTTLSQIVAKKFASLPITSYSTCMTRLVSIPRLRYVPMHYQQKSNPMERNLNTVLLRVLECLEQMWNVITRTDLQLWEKLLKNVELDLKQNRKTLNTQRYFLKRLRSSWLKENLSHIGMRRDQEDLMAS